MTPLPKSFTSELDSLAAIDSRLAGIEQLRAGEGAIVFTYFELFNQSQYQQVARLFSADGSLHPPFESPLLGGVAISRYLHQEADGMTVSLASAEVRSLEEGRLQVDVGGRVALLVFQVAATWRFVLAANRRIESVRVKLLATPEELLSIRPGRVM